MKPLDLMLIKMQIKKLYINKSNNINNINNINKKMYYFIKNKRNFLTYYKVDNYNNRSNFNWFFSRNFFYKLPEQEPLLLGINSVLEKNKKQLKYSYSFFICDRNPNKEYILECLKKDIELLCKTRNLIFFAIIYSNIDPDESKGKTIYINFYFERKIESFYFDYFSNIYTFFSWYHRRYLKQQFILKFLRYGKFGLLKYYVSKIRYLFVYWRNKINYFLFDMDFIEALDRSHPILFLINLCKKIKKWFLLFLSIFEKYSWKRNISYIKVLEVNVYSAKPLKKNLFTRFRNFCDRMYSRYDYITAFSTVQGAIHAALRVFLFAEEEEDYVKEKSIFEVYLEEDIYRLRITKNWDSLTEVTEQLNINTKIIGSEHFKDIISTLKIKKEND